MTLFTKISISLCCFVLLASCASQKQKNIPYLNESISFVDSIPQLDIYQARKSENNAVIIFIHGGYWDEGNKDMYSFLGRNLANKGIITVIPNYTLSPNGNYNTMANEVAEAIKWTHENIKEYNGNPNQIFLMGHSAGGHLISLVGTNPKYLEDVNLIRGIIMNDAAGLDMYSYLNAYPPTKDHHYDVTWTDDPENWKDASPLYFLTEKAPPFLFFVGTKSFPSIISSNQDFAEKLKLHQSDVEINYQSKKHVQMMSQFVNPWNKNYKKIIDFIDSNQ